MYGRTKCGVIPSCSMYIWYIISHVIFRDFPYCIFLRVLLVVRRCTVGMFVTCYECRYRYASIAPTGRENNVVTSSRLYLTRPCLSFEFRDGQPAFEVFTRRGESKHSPQRKARYIKSVKGESQPPGKGRRGTKGATTTVSYQPPASCSDSEDTFLLFPLKERKGPSFVPQLCTYFLNKYTDQH